MRSTSAVAAWLVLLTLVVSACARFPREDRAPRRPPDVSSVPDAVPREEPKSRYGNPQSYEVFGKKYHVLGSADGYRERGVASWYGEKFHGRRTSSGEPYDMYRMTAAHKSLPLPTYVRVTNLKNGRSVTVRVNDRGPFVHNRIIDLSYTAADRLGIIANGTGLVEVEALTGQSSKEIVALQPVAHTETKADEPVSGPVMNQADEVPLLPAEGSRENQAAAESIYVQLGAFSDPLNAEGLAADLASRGFVDVNVMAVPMQERMVYRVRIGPVPGIPELDSLTNELASAGIENYHLAYE